MYVGVLTLCVAPLQSMSSQNTGQTMATSLVSQPQQPQPLQPTVQVIKHITAFTSITLANQCSTDIGLSVAGVTRASAVVGGYVYLYSASMHSINHMRQ